MRDSVYGYKPGSPRTRHPISALILAPGPEPSTSGPTSLSVHAFLLLRSTRSPLSVTRRDFSACMLVLRPSNDRMHASRFIPCIHAREGTHPSPTLTSAFHVSVLRFREDFWQQCENHIKMTTKHKVISDYGFRFGSVVRLVGCTVNMIKKHSKINK